MLSMPLASLAATSAFSSSESAVNIAGWTSTISCTYAAFSCNNIGAGGCCASFPAGFGFSVSFTDLPPCSEGRYYRLSSVLCSYMGSQWGAGHRCWSGGGLERAVTANWIQSSLCGRTDRPVERDTLVNKNCTQPNHFTYIDENGEVVGMKVARGKSESIAELYRTQNFKALALLGVATRGPSITEM